jgi:FMN phosphatase YigB (HAD superfamily)
MTSHPVVAFFDVDNTLLDNDHVQADLQAHLTREFGPENSQRYWDIFEQLRGELGYADYLGALQRYRLDHLHDPKLLRMSSFLVDYPFRDRLYPRALDVLRRWSGFSQTTILSDGDVVFQPLKVERSGLWDAVEGRVLVYIHKERELNDARRRYPGQHYVLIDDKLRILAAVKRVLDRGVTTVFVRQGHYAADPAILAQYPAADVSVARVGDLLNYSVDEILAAAKPAATIDSSEKAPS